MSIIWIVFVCLFLSACEQGDFSHRPSYVISKSHHHTTLEPHTTKGHESELDE